MGCINSSSTKKLNDTKHENVFHVFLQPNTSSIVRGGCWGYIELTARELIFASQGRENVVWLLQHLRRYGLTGDVFSFEAGRRCMTGPGIFRFRCEQPERLYQLFQRCINPISYTTVAAGDDAFTFNERTGIGAADLLTHPSHVFGINSAGRNITIDTNPHTNNYLEPAPMSMAAMRANNLHESFSSSPLSLDLDSPDSVPSLSFTNEVVHFHMNQQMATAVAGGGGLSHSHPTTPGAFTTTTNAATSNLYMKQPVRVATGVCTSANCTVAAASAAVGANSSCSNDCISASGAVYCTLAESNNNATRPNNCDNAATVVGGASSGSGTGSAFSTLSRKTIAKHSSLDVPPEECAPMLLNSNYNQLESQHNYANIDNLGLNAFHEVANNNYNNNNNNNKDLVPASERCYENINRADLPLYLQPPPATRREQLPQKQHQQQQQQQNKEFNNSTPQTPTTPPTTAVNYIVLDLDQPRSPTQYSPKTCFGSGSSLSTGGVVGTAGERADAEVKSLPAVSMISSSVSIGKMSARAATPATTNMSTTLKTNSLQRQQTTTATTMTTAADSRLGYSTIDFIKTYALIKSSTYGADFEHEEHEESRITRHSKCVRKANSISE